MLPSRLRRRVRALGDATAVFNTEGPQIDSEALATIAAACRDEVRLHFSYVARDEQSSDRDTEPNAVVYTGYRWYLVAYDLGREDWRTFRIDRIHGRVRVGARGRHRTVPGGDPAAFVKQRIRGPEGEPGRVRLGLAAGEARRRIPARHATVQEDGPEACIVTTTGHWRRDFLIWMVTLDAPIEVLGPPEMIELGRSLAERLTAATAAPGS